MQTFLSLAFDVTNVFRIGYYFRLHEADKLINQDLIIFPLFKHTSLHTWYNVV